MRVSKHEGQWFISNFGLWNYLIQSLGAGQPTHEIWGFHSYCISGIWEKVADRYELLGYNINYSSFWSLNLHLHSFQSLSFLPQAGKLDAILTVSHPAWCLLRRKKFFSLTFIHRTFYADGVWLHPWLILNWRELKGSPKNEKCHGNRHLSSSEAKEPCATWWGSRSFDQNFFVWAQKLSQPTRHSNTIGQPVSQWNYCSAMIGNFHQSILIHWHELSPRAGLGPLKWLQVTSTELAHSLQNNYPNPLSQPNPLTVMKCPPMQGADIFQQHQPLWNANQKSLLLKYATLSASINRPSYIISTTIIKKHLQNTHLCGMLCCWAQNTQMHEVLTSGRSGYRTATSRFSCCLFSTDCA